jgi:hypothetical protein
LVNVKGEKEEKLFQLIIDVDNLDY